MTKFSGAVKLADQQFISCKLLTVLTAAILLC